VQSYNDSLNTSSIPSVLWMTGLPCSGKSTIARELKNHIRNLVILDGDELREWLSPKDFSREGRIEHNKKVAHLAKFMVKQGLPVCVALISPYAQNRADARNIIGNGFVEVYVRCDISECESRDIKGMYKLARDGKITNFTGVDDIFEVPTAPDIVIDTDKMGPLECVSTILRALDSKK
jgi:adenylylsulfate kinase